MTKQSGSAITIALTIACVLFVAFGSYLWVQNTKLQSARETLQNDLSTAQALNSELMRNMTELNTTLNDELTAQTLKTEQIATEYSAYRNKTTQYFSLGKIIVQDMNTYDEHYQDWRDTNDKEEEQRIVKRLDAELVVAKDHLEEYRKLLADNKAFFKELGVDVDKELDSVYKLITGYNTLDKNIEDYYAT